MTERETLITPNPMATSSTLINHMFRAIVEEVRQGCKNGWKVLHLDPMEDIKTEAPRSLMFTYKEDYCTIFFAMSKNQEVEVNFFINSESRIKKNYNILSVPLYKIIQDLDFLLLQFEEKGKAAKFPSDGLKMLCADS